MGGLEIVDTPGDHVSLLQDPNVAVLAEKVNERIRMCSFPRPKIFARSSPDSVAPAVEADLEVQR